MNVEWLSMGSKLLKGILMITMNGEWLSSITRSPIQFDNDTVTHPVLHNHLSSWVLHIVIHKHIPNHIYIPNHKHILDMHPPYAHPQHTLSPRSFQIPDVASDDLSNEARMHLDENGKPLDPVWEESLRQK